MVEDDSTNVVDAFKADLGSDFDYLTDAIAPAITKLVGDLTTPRVTEAVRPLAAQVKAVATRESQKETAATMRTFGEKHPDWQEHEDAMLELSQKLSPRGMTETEYLDHLYTLVTADARASARQKAIEKGVAEGVRAAAVTAPPETPTIQEAYKAAKRGERWE